MRAHGLYASVVILLLIDLQISQAYVNLIATQNNLLLQIPVGPFCLFLMNTSGLSPCVFVFLYIYFLINFSQNKKTSKALVSPNNFAIKLRTKRD